MCKADAVTEMQARGWDAKAVKAPRRMRCAWCNKFIEAHADCVQVKSEAVNVSRMNSKIYWSASDRADHIACAEARVAYWRDAEAKKASL